MKKTRRTKGALLLYIILLNAVLFAATLFLHEAGHILAGMLLGCRGELAVSNIFNPNVPGLYANMSCPPGARISMAAWLGLSGFVLALPFALSFLSLRRMPEKNLSLIVFGFSIILGGLDFLLLLANAIVVYSSFIAGLAVLFLGEFFLLDDYLLHRFHREKSGEFAKRILH